ncbi:MAG: DUF3788 family protein [Bacillota bacterium]|jgi:hypothetical protein|nr:DUF3788 family protein [Bacillota bacterium]HPZ23017.1 DUF3788 family protein [Bacillota bacterium]
MLAVKPTQEEIRTILGAEVFGAWEGVRHFILDHYNMDVTWDDGGKYGAYECKFRKSGKTLCTLYVKKEELVVLIIFGKDEREKFEAERREFSPQLQQIYDAAKTYHDGKWMYISLRDSRLVPDITRMLVIKKKPNRRITMCGYICDHCKAYARNIKKHDERERLSALWGKYYGLDIPAGAIYCDGCRSTKKDARRIDNNCPVRACVLENKVDNCSECSKYPCAVFSERKGLSCAEARQVLGESFSEEEYEEYMLAYDNKSRLDRMVRAK